MVTLGTLLDLCGACALNIVIYDNNVSGVDADNFGDLLWDDEVGGNIPDDVLSLNVVSFEIGCNFDDAFCIWVDGPGIPHNY